MNHCSHPEKSLIFLYGKRPSRQCAKRESATTGNIPAGSSHHGNSRVCLPRQSFLIDTPPNRQTLHIRRPASVSPRASFQRGARSSCRRHEGRAPVCRNKGKTRPQATSSSEITFYNHYTATPPASRPYHTAYIQTWAVSRSSRCTQYYVMEAILGCGHCVIAQESEIMP